MASMRTPLYEEHQKLGARFVDFGGWDLPVQFTSITEEHEACRKNAAVFDVSHMGEFLFSGSGASDFLNYAVTNDVSKLKVGQAFYTALCNDEGGVIDDLIIYKLKEDKFMMVVNASNELKDFKHFETLKASQGHQFGDFKFENVSDQWCLLAVQGPKAEAIVNRLAKDQDLTQLKMFRLIEAKALKDLKIIIARTGYTGEDGFELFIPWKEAPKVWRALIGGGEDDGLIPAGLGARDTLRMEAALCLYGQELTEKINPHEARIGWTVKEEKEDFIGKYALDALKVAPTRKTVGIAMKERGIPRTDYDVYMGEEKVGKITSGTQSITLNKPIAMALVSIEAAEAKELQVDIRGKKIPAEIVDLPFYKRSKEKNK